MTKARLRRHNAPMLEWQNGSKPSTPAEADSCVLNIEALPVPSDLLAHVWKKVAADVETLCVSRKAPAFVLQAGIWMLGGQVIFDGSIPRGPGRPSRLVYRFAVDIPPLDVASHELPDTEIEPVFHAAYDRLLESVQAVVIESFEAADVQETFLRLKAFITIHDCADMPPLHELI